MKNNKNDQRKDGCDKHDSFDGSCKYCLLNRDYYNKLDSGKLANNEVFLAKHDKKCHGLSIARAVKNSKSGESVSDVSPRNLDDWAEMMVEAARIRAKENNDG